MPSVGTTEMAPLDDLASRSGHPEPARLVRTGRCRDGWVVAASGLVVGTASPLGAATGVWFTGSAGTWALFWITWAAARIEGILAYRYRPGHAVCPTSRWPLIALRKRSLTQR